MTATSVRQRGAFFIGLIAGLASGVLVYVGSSRMPGVDAAAMALELQWLGKQFALIELNLRGSLLPFSTVLLCYLWQLQVLRRRLASPPVVLEQLLRHEQLLDLCASLFFGIGVIWTAIGMRAALLHALSNPLAVTGDSAFTVLQRLVDGGILLALSTTVVGGIGGYMMRTAKSLLLGNALSVAYVEAGRAPLDHGLTLLSRIELQLARQSGAEPGAPST